MRKGARLFGIEREREIFIEAHQDPCAVPDTRLNWNMKYFMPRKNVRVSVDCFHLALFSRVLISRGDGRPRNRDHEELSFARGSRAVSTSTARFPTARRAVYHPAGRFASAREYPSAATLIESRASEWK